MASNRGYPPPTRGTTDRPWSRSAVSASMTAAGLIMAAAPLALWVAPDIVTFKLVLVVCLLACVAVMLLARIGGAGPGPGAHPPHRPPPGLPTAAIEGLQNQGDMSRRRSEALKEALRREPE